MCTFSSFSIVIALHLVQLLNIFKAYDFILIHFILVFTRTVHVRVIPGFEVSPENVPDYYLTDLTFGVYANYYFAKTNKVC